MPYNIDDLLLEKGITRSSVSDEDYSLAQKNEAFGNNLVGYKSQWNTANAAGDTAGKTAANKGLEADRLLYGNYTAGTSGTEHNVLSDDYASYKKNNPNVYISSWDNNLANENPEYATALMKGKTMAEYDPTAANQYLNGQRSTYGGYKLDAEGDEGWTSTGYVPNAENKAARDDLTNKILTREDFTYDPAGDKAYQSYKQQYNREGDRAAENAMTLYSMRGGGLPSSVAMSATQQAQNYYNSQLADRIPELQQLAYEKWQNQGNEMRDNLGMLLDAEKMDYGMYRDNVGDSQINRQFDYNAGQDKIKNGQWDQSFGETVRMDNNTITVNANNMKNDDERTQIAGGQLGLEKDQFGYGKLQDKAVTLAASGNFDGYLDLGYSPEMVQTMTTAFQKGDKKMIADIMAANGDFSGYIEFGMTPEQAKSAANNFNAAKQYEGAAFYGDATGDYTMVGDYFKYTPEQNANVNQGIAAQKAPKYSVSSSGSSQSGNSSNAGNNNTNGSNTFRTPQTYGDVINLASSYGVGPDTINAQLLTPDQWEEGKSNNADNIGNSYGEYLQYFTEFFLENYTK